MTTCKLCGYSFKKARADIYKSTLAVHFMIMHPLEKKGFRRLIRKLRKLRPTIKPPVHHKRNRPDHRINFWARIPVYAQTKVTSEKSKKRTKRKKESIRAGALLPDVIRLNNHVKHTRLSRKNFESNCQELSRVCNKEEICDAHSSLYNLKQISGTFRIILNQPLETIPD